MNTTKMITTTETAPQPSLGSPQAPPQGGDDIFSVLFPRPRVDHTISPAMDEWLKEQFRKSNSYNEFDKFLEGWNKKRDHQYAVSRLGPQADLRDAAISYLYLDKNYEQKELFDHILTWHPVDDSLKSLFLFGYIYDDMVRFNFAFASDLKADFDLRCAFKDCVDTQNSKSGMEDTFFRHGKTWLAKIIRVADAIGACSVELDKCLVKRFPDYTSFFAKQDPEGLAGGLGI